MLTKFKTKNVTFNEAVKTIFLSTAFSMVAEK
jgi:hypothetical protein